MEFRMFIIILVSAAVISFIWFLRGLIVTPVPLSRNQICTAVLTVCGNAPELPQTIDALSWLCENGTISMQILITDVGMDEETRQMAELLIAEKPNLCLCHMDEVQTFIVSQVEGPR